MTTIMIYFFIFVQIMLDKHLFLCYIYAKFILGLDCSRKIHFVRITNYY